MGLARNHMARVLSEKEAGTTKNSATGKAAKQADLMAAQLRAHQMELKNIKATQGKIIKKRNFIGDYWPYVDGVLAADTGNPDNILMTIMVWALDIGSFDRAIDIATYALCHDLTMPENFKRSAQEILVEEMAEHIITHIEDADKQKDFIRYMGDVIDLTVDLDMADEVRAKGNKAMGLLLQEKDPEQAVGYLQAALDLNDKSGVKGLLNKLKKQIPPPS